MNAVTHSTQSPVAPIFSEIKVTFHSLRRDLTEGRRWTVITPERHTYVVDFWQGADGLRYGKCQCAAGSCQKSCKHLKAAARADAELFVEAYRQSERFKINRAMAHWYGN